MGSRSCAPGRPAILGRWAVAAAALAVLAWLGGAAVSSYRSYSWDDSYITYIYGRSLAEGRGLRYNAADVRPTEGFSSLAHVLLVAMGLKMGIDPLLFTRLVSLAVFLSLPFLVGVPLAVAAGVGRATAITAAAAVQTASFLTEATAYHLHLGMDTFIYLGPLAALAGWCLREIGGDGRSGSPVRLAWGLGSAALVLLGRPEGLAAVLLIFPWVYLVRRLFLRRLAPRNDRVFFLTAALAVAAVAAYLLWKLSYFGYLLPNPYYVKSGRSILGLGPHMLPGLATVGEFLGMVLPWAAAGLGLLLVSGARGARGAVALAAAPGLVLALLYAGTIPEAAYHYRYQYPCLVFLHLLLAGAVCQASRRRGLGALPAILVPAALAAVIMIGGHERRLSANPAGWLSFRLTDAAFAQAAFGADLARTGLGQRAAVALTGAGAVAWHSGFRSLDIFGLNDNRLSGRRPLSAEDFWTYVDGWRPDVYYSSLPPATPGSDAGGFDPVFRSMAVRLAVGGKISNLMRYGDPARVTDYAVREMRYLREHYVFGAAYATDMGVWLIAYVRRDSPHRDLILRTLRRSPWADWTSDLGRRYVNDPRKLSD